MVALVGTLAAHCPVGVLSVLAVAVPAWLRPPHAVLACHLVNVASPPMFPAATACGPEWGKESNTT